jgi:hypothetical protein
MVSLTIITSTAVTIVQASETRVLLKKVEKERRFKKTREGNCQSKEMQCGFEASQTLWIVS